MKSNVDNIENYINDLTIERREPMLKLHQTIFSNLPKGFEAQMSYGMIGYVVPHHIYPSGYHCNPQLPLPFMAIASQKNGISLYHMGLYADENIFDWFKNEYLKNCKTKLDIGKSCIRFKKTEHIPFDLLAELVKKMTVNDWISMYEINLKK